MGAVCWILGLISVGNGLWMLFSPEGWYYGLPAAVPDTGPLNLHFVRDIGSAFMTLGIALWAGAVKPAWRRPALYANALFFTLHALVHVSDLLSGRLHGDHWLVDLPGVFAPTLVLLVLCLPRFWRDAEA
jgi:hypothetical protein